MNVNTRWAILAVPLSLLGLPQASANPLDSDTPTKETGYSSSFDDYVQDEDVEAGGWVQANERVGEIGGWRTYLRQAQEPMDGSKPTSSDQGAMPHSGHGSNPSSQKGAN
tara:strand:+ start:1269 stop:1598 length:330 start_codon:yes stop_codon:yes gene_type:complete